LDTVRSEEVSVQDVESTTFETDHHHHRHGDHRRHACAHNPAEHSYLSAVWYLFLFISAPLFWKHVD
jgi:hypothetical protein